MKTKDILDQKVKDRFGIEISESNLHFVNLDLELTNSLEPKNYPTFTLVWQAIAFIRVSIHSVITQPCDVFVDSMGVGFAYPFVSIFFGVKIYSYTHYPIVSTDMV